MPTPFNRELRAAMSLPRSLLASDLTSYVIKGRRSPVLRQLSNQSGTPNNSEMARRQRFSLTTPTPPKQLEYHSWLAGYADRYIDGLEEAWARINAEIEREPPLQRPRQRDLAMLVL